MVVGLALLISSSVVIALKTVCSSFDNIFVIKRSILKLNKLFARAIAQLFVTINSAKRVKDMQTHI